MTVKAAKPAKKKIHWFRRDWRLYVMLILPVAFYLIFCYKPMAGIMLAFQKYNPVVGMWGSKFIGLKNFEDVMKLADFKPALVNTLWLNLLGLIAGFPVPIVLAIMLNELKAIKFKKVSQTLLYLPHFLSWIIIGGMVLQIFAPPDRRDQRAADEVGMDRQKHSFPDGRSALAGHLYVYRCLAEHGLGHDPVPLRHYGHQYGTV